MSEPSTTIHMFSVFYFFCNVFLFDFTCFLADRATRLPKFAIFENFIFTMILL